MRVPRTRLSDARSRYSLPLKPLGWALPLPGILCSAFVEPHSACPRTLEVERDGTEADSRVRQLGHSQLETGMVAQRIKVVGILIAASDRRHQCLQDVAPPMDDPAIVPGMGIVVGHTPGNAHPVLRPGQQQYPAVLVQPPTIERCGAFFRQMAGSFGKVQSVFNLLAGPGLSLWMSIMSIGSDSTFAGDGRIPSASHIRVLN